MDRHSGTLRYTRAAVVAGLVLAFAGACEGRSQAATSGSADVYTVTVSEGGPGGRVLVAGNGWSLYVFDGDTPNQSMCIDQCAETWPPLTVVGSEPTKHPDLPGVLTTLSRPDGSRQVTYGGRPLYYFAGDNASGETNGNGVDARWHLARPSLIDEFVASRSAADATIQSQDRRSWQPSSVTIAPGGTVRWQNLDPASAHGVACVVAESSSPCPWPDPLELPKAARDGAGNVVASEVQATFPRPGVFAFRCTVVPEMTGTVVVGAPATPAGR